jgi:hypothetical protein
MKSLSQFTKQHPLTETTVPEHLQHIPDYWDHHSHVDDDTNDKITKAMTHGSFTTFPLEKGSVDADADVVDHLTKHGYEIKDYTKGIASIKKTVGNPEAGIPLREKYVDEKIGSILEKTGAHEDIKKAFVNDPSRSVSKSDEHEHHVVVSTTPLAIAGMTIGTSWENQSCMNLEKGAYKHKLEDDSRHGTHVAYLIHKSDERGMKYGEPERPLARIALKPYHSEDATDTIFRPENKVWGSGGTHFSNAVASWSVKNYPAKHGEVYNKNKEVYDDTGNDTYVSRTKEDIEHAIDNHETITTEHNQAFDKSIIDHAIAYGTKKFSGKPEVNQFTSHFVSNMADIGNLSTEHVAKLKKLVSHETDPSMNGKRIGLQTLATKHGDKFSGSGIEEYTKLMGTYPTNRMLMSPKLPDHIIDSLPTSQYSFVRHSKLKEKHIDKIVDSYNKNESGSAYPLRDFRNRLNSKHIDSLIDNKDKTRDSIANTVLPIVLESENFTKEHHDKLMNLMGDSSKVFPMHEAGAKLLLSQSKHASFDDAKSLATKEHTPLKSTFSNLMRNEHVIKTEGEKVANHFVENFEKPVMKKFAGGHQEGIPRYTTDVTGFAQSGMNTRFPQEVSVHFKPEHYLKMARQGMDISFEHPDHSNKFLDAYHTVAAEKDAAISDHIGKMLDTHDEYDEDDDTHVTDAKEDLNNHMERYYHAVDTHIDDHVSDDSGDYIANYNEHEKTRDRIKKLDKLDHYLTPNTATRYDSHEHFDEWMGEHASKLDELEHNTENREYY